jgi:hypothetical protein
MVVTLNDIARFGNIPERYREVVLAVGRVIYEGRPIGEIPRVMASTSAFEAALEKHRQEAEHALIGLALANDLPVEASVGDKPDVDLRYHDGFDGGAEVGRIGEESLLKGDAESAAIEREIKEGVANSACRGRTMMGRYVVLTMGVPAKRILRARIVRSALRWIDDGLPILSKAGHAVQLDSAYDGLIDNSVSARLGTLPGTAWELKVAARAVTVPPMELTEAVRRALNKKRRLSQEYRYRHGLRLVLPIVGLQAEILISQDLADLRCANLEMSPFERVIVYRDLDFAVLEPPARG